jgi:antitoxin VapB
MNARIPTQSLPQQTLTTVFTSGNSQAVRLPKEFRFNTKQVTIERRGDEVVLRENRRSLGQTLRDAFADLPPLTDKESKEWDEAMAAIKNQGPLESRAMWTDPQFWKKSTETKPVPTRKTPKTGSALRKAKTARP